MNCQSSQTGNANPCGPAVDGALIADPRYYSLATTLTGQLLGVPLGSNQQVFLKPTTPGSYFVVMSPDGQARFTNQPAVSLPPLNAPSMGSYPVPGGFTSIIISTGADPQLFYRVQAPTEGKWILQSENGTFTLVEAGSIPGIQAVGDAGSTAKGQILVLVQNVDDEWIGKKLTVADKRVIVGDIDIDGLAGHKSLPDNQELFHPLGKFTALTFRTIKGLDADGNPITGGFDVVVTTGGGAVTDSVSLVYSPSTGRVYKAAAQTSKQVSIKTVNTAGISAVYASLPGGHGNLGSVTTNYPTVLILAQIKTQADASPTYGLFRDGTLVEEFPLLTSSDASVSYLDLNVPAGVHTYELRYKSAASMSVYYSSVAATTTAA